MSPFSPLLPPLHLHLSPLRLCLSALDHSSTQELITEPRDIQRRKKERGKKIMRQLEKKKGEIDKRKRIRRKNEKK